MLWRLLLLFTLLPLVELVVLAWIGAHTSWIVPICLVLGPGIAGAWLVRRHSWRTMQQIRAEMAAGTLPANSLYDGFFVFLAGLLLILPGVLTDCMAIALLVPATRDLLKRYLRHRFGQNARGGFTAPSTSFGGNSGVIGAHDRIIDVRVIESPRP